MLSLSAYGIVGWKDIDEDCKDSSGWQKEEASKNLASLEGLKNFLYICLKEVISALASLHYHYPHISSITPISYLVAS